MNGRTIKNLFDPMKSVGITLYYRFKLLVIQIDK
jgi:hypothetical protein